MAAHGWVDDRAVDAVGLFDPCLGHLGVRDEQRSPRGRPPIPAEQAVSQSPQPSATYGRKAQSIVIFCVEPTGRGVHIRNQGYRGPEAVHEGGTAGEDRVGVIVDLQTAGQARECSEADLYGTRTRMSAKAAKRRDQPLFGDGRRKG